MRLINFVAKSLLLQSADKEEYFAAAANQPTQREQTSICSQSTRSIHAKPISCKAIQMDCKLNGATQDNKVPAGQSTVQPGPQKLWRPVVVCAICVFSALLSSSAWLAITTWVWSSPFAACLQTIVPARHFLIAEWGAQDWTHITAGVQPICRGKCTLFGPSHCNCCSCINTLQDPWTICC